ncbi:unnamed protein product, partial [Discosporangium mesarthrocarpum]
MPPKRGKKGKRRGDESSDEDHNTQAPGVPTVKDEDVGHSAATKGKGKGAGAGGEGGESRKAPQKAKKKRGKGHEDSDDDDGEALDPLAHLRGNGGRKGMAVGDDSEDDRPKKPLTKKEKRRLEEQRQREKRGKGHEDSDDDDGKALDPLAHLRGAGGRKGMAMGDDSEDERPRKPLTKKEKRRLEEQRQREKEEDDHDGIAAASAPEVPPPPPKAADAGVGGARKGGKKLKKKHGKGRDDSADDGDEQDEKQEQEQLSVRSKKSKGGGEDSEGGGSGEEEGGGKRRMSKKERKKTKQVREHRGMSVPNTTPMDEVEEEVEPTAAGRSELSTAGKEGAAPDAAPAIVDTKECSETVPKTRNAMPTPTAVEEAPVARRRRGGGRRRRLQEKPKKPPRRRRSLLEDLDDDRYYGSDHEEKSAMGKGGKAAAKETIEDEVQRLVRAEKTSGKGITSRQRKKITQEAEARRRMAEEEQIEEIAHREGAQFGCSQTAVPAGDQQWLNSLDVTIEAFSISAHDKTLFKDASLQVVHGRKYGLVGPNGAGKSTLLKMIAAGELKIPPRWIDCLYVEQEVVADDTPAVIAVMKADKIRWRLMEEERKVNRLLREDPENEELNERLQKVHEELHIMGGDGAEARARRILFGLGFDDAMQV